MKATTLLLCAVVCTVMMPQMATSNNHPTTDPSVAPKSLVALESLVDTESRTGEVSQPDKVSQQPTGYVSPAMRGTKPERVYSRDKQEARERRQYRASSSEFNKRRGYFGLAELGVGMYLGDEAFGLSATVINGYRFFPQLAVGLGVGVEWLYPETVGVPIFVHLRSDILERKISPYVAFNFGVDRLLGRGATLVEPSVGVGFNVGEKGRLTVGLSYVLMIPVIDGMKIRVGYSF